MAGMVIVKFLFKEPHKLINNSITEAVKDNKEIEVEEVFSSKELATILASFESGLVFVLISTKDDMAELASFVKKESRVLMKNCDYKLIVIDQTKSSEANSIISKLDITDIVPSDAPGRLFKHKIKLWISTGKKYSEKRKESSDSPSSRISLMEPLDLEDDTWIFKDSVQVKKVLSNWSLMLLAPGPAVAKWKKINPNEWKLVVRPEDLEVFVPNNGNWYFRGQYCPEFKWKEKMWLFKGEDFELYFKGDQGYFVKVQAKKEIIHIANNSIHALSKEHLIHQTFEVKSNFNEATDRKNVLNDSDNIFSEEKSISNDEQNNLDHSDLEYLKNNLKTTFDSLNPNIDPIDFFQTPKTKIMMEINDRMIECEFYDYYKNNIVIYFDLPDAPKETLIGLKIDYTIGNNTGCVEIFGKIFEIENTKLGFFALVELDEDAREEIEKFLIGFDEVQKSMFYLFSRLSGVNLP